jgi:methylenetetrahydrofolate dehydrogenase(NAD+)/5,10-methenyltetrahydrofolate cyclohydrolase
LFYSKKAKIIDGRRIAKDIQQEIKVEIEEWLAAGHRRPQLTAVLVGDDPASSTYVRNKMKAAKNVGMYVCTVCIR